MTTARLPLKDQLFTREKVELIAGEIKHVDSAFKADEFVTMVVARFPELELKARIAWITTCLEGHLPRNFRKAASAPVRSLPDPALSDGDFGDFIWPEAGNEPSTQGHDHFQSLRLYRCSLRPISLSPLRVTRPALIVHRMRWRRPRESARERRGTPRGGQIR